MSGSFGGNEYDDDPMSRLSELLDQRGTDGISDSMLGDQKIGQDRHYNISNEAIDEELVTGIREIANELAGMDPRDHFPEDSDKEEPVPDLRSREEELLHQMGYFGGVHAGDSLMTEGKSRGMTSDEFRDSVLDRWESHEKSRKDELARMQKEKHQKEMEECTSHPKISRLSKNLVTKQEPIYQRINQVLAMKEEKLNKKRLDLNREKGEERHLTHQPKINKSDQPRRSTGEFIQEMYSWQSKKVCSIIQSQEEKFEEEGEELKFAPRINSNSKNIARSKHGQVSLQERSQLQWEEHEKKMSRMRTEAKPTFKPTINQKSKKLNQKGESAFDRLYKNSQERRTKQKELEEAAYRQFGKSPNKKTGAKTPVRERPSTSRLYQANDTRSVSPIAMRRGMTDHKKNIMSQNPAITSAQILEELNEGSWKSGKNFERFIQPESSDRKPTKTNFKLQQNYRINTCQGALSDENTYVNEVEMTPDIFQILNRLS